MRPPPPMPSLWDQPQTTLGRMPAGSQPVETSELAADRQSEKIGAKRLRVLRVLYAVTNPAGKGWTADEMAALLNQQANQVAPRLTELVSMGYAVKLEERRVTRLGSSAVAHAVSEAGRKLLERSEAA